MDSVAWDQRYRQQEFVWTSEPNRFLVSETQSLAPARAIDLACGEGRNAVWLAERGWRVTGVDFSSVAIEKARQLEAARVRWTELRASFIRKSWCSGRGKDRRR